MNPLLRKLAFAALLIVLPFSGIRVICVESSTEPSAPAVTSQAEAAEDTLTDCERLCPFHPPASVTVPHADPQSSSEDEDCALSSAAAALQMLATIAILKSEPPLAIPDLVTDLPVASTPLYSDPALTLLAPPPKSVRL